MHFLPTLVCLFPILAAPALAQQENPFVPSPKQDVFARMVGTWEGSGTWRHSPETPAEKWTGCSTAKSALNGHVIDEDVTVDLGSTVPGPLRMRTFWGWEKETQRYIAAEINNSGEIHYREIHWEGKDTMNWSSSINRMGKLTTEHWTLTFGKDSYRIQGIQVVGKGKPFVHVEGSYKRVKAVPAAFKNPKEFTFTEVAPAMKVAHKLVGNYRIDGWMIPMPGMTKVPIGAVERITPAHAGSILMFYLDGDDSPMGTYAGLGAMAWNEHRKCFQQLFISNMGEILIEDTRIRGDKMITTSSSVRAGEPVLSRALTLLSKDGKLKTLDVHGMTAGGAPEHVFHADCKPIPQKK